MQPVNERTLQNQVITDQQRTIGHKEITSSTGKTALREHKVILPEDILTLSKDRSSTLSLKKGPSTPVTPAESKALRAGFSVYA